MQKYHVPDMIGIPLVLLYVALDFFAIGLIDFLWHLNQQIAAYISALCCLVLILHIITTLIPCFTTRSPFKTRMSMLVGNLWRGMLQRHHPTGLMEEEEWVDIENLGGKLDANSIKWLMDHTQNELAYLVALRAERVLGNSPMA
jgi:hypothetical protein